MAKCPPLVAGPSDDYKVRMRDNKGMKEHDSFFLSSGSDERGGELGCKREAMESKKIENK